MPTKLPQNFGHAARPGEIVLPMSCGYPGIVMGPAYLINNQHYNDREILKKSIRDNHYTAEQQSQRLEDAFSRCEAHYERQKLNSKNMPVEIDDEFEGMVETESLLLISEKSKVLSEMKSGKSPELAIYDHFETRIATLKKTYKTSMAAQNKIMAELSAGTIKNQDAEEALRKEDFAILNSQRYIGMVSYQRDMLISQLFGKTLKSLETAPPGSIPAASSYPVGDLIYLRNSNGMGIRIHGLICWDESMNNNDHTAIMSKAARATLAKIDKAAAERIREGDRVIIDGRRKIVIINPAPQTIAEMTKELQQHKADSQAITDKSHARKWAKSVNEETIKISANIGYADDMMATQNVNAAAIGLYRTEIPVLTRLYGTNLSKWIEIFETVAKRSIDNQNRTKSVTMRTADLVGDKKKNMRPEEIERLIRNQLEAIHTVSKEYPKTFYVMFPQIDNIADFEKYAAWHREAAEKVGVAPLKCGSMIESVSAVALLNQILDHKDLEFISVGTNDLIANVLNYDRYSSEANEKYDPTNPAVLIQLREIITKANAKRVPVSVCGDMASDPRYFALLVGLGYKHVSSAVGLVPMMKEIGNRIDTEKARALVETIFKNPKMTKQEREQLLDDFNQKELGLYPDGQIEMAWPPEERPPAAAATPNDA